MELCLHGRWGTVCDDSWDSRDAAVICRQLGYTQNGLPWGAYGARFGTGSGLILLDEVDCGGSEETLLGCRASSLGHHNCIPSEDAGVFCPCECPPCVGVCVGLWACVRVCVWRMLECSVCVSVHSVRSMCVCVCGGCRSVLSV